MIPIIADSQYKLIHRSNRLLSNQFYPAMHCVTNRVYGATTAAGVGPKFMPTRSRSAQCCAYSADSSLDLELDIATPPSPDISAYNRLETTQSDRVAVQAHTCCVARNRGIVSVHIQ